MDLFILLSGHAIGDYPMQGEYLATTKNSYIWHLFMHSVIYTACVMFGFWLITHGITYGLMPIITMFVLISHVVIDYLKGTGRISYAMDQSAHIVVLGILWYLSF